MTVLDRPDVAVEPAGGTAGALPGVPKKNRTDLYLAGGLTALCLVLLAWNITGFPMASDDEGTYLAQAWAVAHGKGLAHYTYWYDHPPLAWIQLAGLSWLPALVFPTLLSVAGGRLAMLPVEAVTLLLVYVICKRLGMRRWAAALGLLTFGLSPLALTMNRQIYLDSFAVMWMLAALTLALSPRRHLWHYAAAGGAAAIAVLSKETMVITLPAVLVAMWQKAARSTTRPWAFGAFASGLALVGIFYPLYALLRGELFPGDGHVSLIGAWQFQLMSRSGSGSVFDEASGSGALIDSWLYYDSVILFGGLAATVVALFVRKLRAPGIAGLVLALVAIRPGGYLPAMYVVQALPFLAILIAGVTEFGFDKLRPARVWWRWTILGVAVVTALGFVVPHWYVGDRRALVANDNAPYQEAADYLRTQLPDRAGTTLVVDDVLWLDAVRAGYTRDNVIWFYKLDLDTAVAARLANGWRDVDYIVSTPALRQDPNSLPTVAKLLTNSTVVASFGPGSGPVEIRRVDKENP
ncbi:hypothetical protein GCM10010435_95440 [Winogradskya consettensis]|uniref:ArnT-like N-terminal domain-containing protein n=1 Tax=Winogradskya consettensis TaxID=113560 RepID=A0A919T2B3_9ACTN|nr:phospholipid carrier-dependent glycosyltransferase [Actinoplanes consettensis]GIM83730.1 hypothetical protein Aco04nite_88000 [Actinoplanes consettensis]